MKKTIFLTLVFSSLVTLPVMAQLGKVWTDFQSYSTDLQYYLRDNIKENSRFLETKSQNSVNNSTGALKIPDPIAAGKQIHNDMNSNSTLYKFENNPAIRSNSLINEINRLITRGSVSGVTGANGQTLLKTKLQNTEITLEKIAEFTDRQDNKDLLDQIDNFAANISLPNAANLIASLTSKLNSRLQLQSIRIQTEQSKIIGETFAQTVQTNQFLQYSNLNLANISQQVEESNRARRVDTSAEAARLLRTTSQIDLFGRKVEK